MNNHEYFGRKINCPYCSIPLEMYEVDDTETEIDWIVNRASIDLALSATCPQCGSRFNWMENHIVAFTEDTFKDSRNFAQDW